MLEVLTAADLNDAHFEEIADFFRLIFNNFWPEYVVCVPCDAKLEGGMRRSALEVFGESEAPVSLDVMDDVDALPRCPTCGAEMQVFHDRDTVLKSTRRKLEQHGQVALLRDEVSGAVAGFTFGYGCTLWELFYNEWRNPYHYMADPPSEQDRSFEVLARRLNETFPEDHFERDTRVFGWNCIATMPMARLNGLKNTGLLLGGLFQSPAVLAGGEYVIGEVQVGSTSHALFGMLGGIDVPGVIGEANTVVAAKPEAIPRDFGRFFRDVIRQSLGDRRRKVN